MREAVLTFESVNVHFKLANSYFLAIFAMVIVQKTNKPKFSIEVGLTIESGKAISFSQVRSKNEYHRACVASNNFEFYARKGWFKKYLIPNKSIIKEDDYNTLLTEVHAIVKECNIKRNALKQALAKNPYLSHRQSFMMHWHNSCVAQTTSNTLSKVCYACYAYMFLIFLVIPILFGFLIGVLTSILIDLITCKYFFPRYTDAEIQWIENIFLQHSDADYDKLSDFIVDRFKELAEKYSRLTGKEISVWYGIESVVSDDTVTYIDSFMLLFGDSVQHV